jgi:hypothetical protein
MVEAKTKPGKTASGATSGAAAPAAAPPRPAERPRPDRQQAVPTPPAVPGTKAPALGAPPTKAPAPAAPGTKAPAPEKKPVKEIGGPKGPEPTRYGDWERKGRCIDF